MEEGEEEERRKEKEMEMKEETNMVAKVISE